MKRSGDRVIGRSGDRKQNLTTEERRRGESGDRAIGPWGDPNQNLRAETPCTATISEVLTQIPTPVILSGARRKSLPPVGDGRGVEGSRECLASRCSIKAFSRELPDASSALDASSGFLRLTSQDRLFDSPSSREAGLRLAQDDRRKESGLYNHVSRALTAFRQILDCFQAVGHLFLITLREIFDENAYERFLRRGQISRSVESYRAFLLEREEGIARKARCC